MNYIKPRVIVRKGENGANFSASVIAVPSGAQILKRRPDFRDIDRSYRRSAIRSAFEAYDLLVDYYKKHGRPLDSILGEPLWPTDKGHHSLEVTFEDDGSYEVNAHFPEFGIPKYDGVSHLFDEVLLRLSDASYPEGNSERAVLAESNQG